MSKVKQPTWYKPSNEQPKLKVFNTFTHEKDEFIPANGNVVNWYCCGPTVYDASHMGHARTFITFDILRRIMQDYFNYDVNYVMNVTDIDDKIILRARQTYLVKQKKEQSNQLNEKIVKEIEGYLLEYMKKQFNDFLSSKKNTEVTSINDITTFNKEDFKSLDNLEKKAKLSMYYDIAFSSFKGLEKARDNIKNKNVSKESASELIESSKGVVGIALDAIHGSEVTDPKIFRELAAYWENEFFKDIKDLNILYPDVVTRVSQFVPEIVEFIQKIIDNGYGYESEGSVYFDTVAFDNSPKHDYCKLAPWSKGDTKLMEEGEGSLGIKLSGKKNPADFALWKKSKPGEPQWESPWGYGRPGWHIECSVMASRVLGSNIDIHSGGIDLAFPHHDNEIAQSEAHFDNKQWMNYFLHAGHLHIDGQKMSKSLKNFVTIQEALQKYTANQIRWMFLLHAWDSVLDYKDSTMTEAISVERTFNNFFVNVKAIINEQKNKIKEFTTDNNYSNLEDELFKNLMQCQNAVNVALCDNFDTVTAIQSMLDIISKVNVYISQKNQQKKEANAQILGKIARFLTKMIKCFGLTPDTDAPIGFVDSSSVGGNKDDLVMPYLQVLSKFRDNVRNLSINKKEHKEILMLCDKLRDEDLVDLGVSLDDRDDGVALVKLVDRETLIKQREEKLEKEKQKRLQKEAKQAEAAKKRAEKLAKGKTPPNELFKTEEYKKLYSEWDENGMPTKDIEGKELSKSAVKKLTKLYNNQIKLHEEYKKSLEN